MQKIEASLSMAVFGQNASNFIFETTWVNTCDSQFKIVGKDWNMFVLITFFSVFLQIDLKN